MPDRLAPLFLTVADRRTGHLLADQPSGQDPPMVSVNAHPEGHRSHHARIDVSMKTVDGILSVRAKIGSPVGLPGDRRAGG